MDRTQTTIFVDYTVVFYTRAILALPDIASESIFSFVTNVVERLFAIEDEYFLFALSTNSG